MTVQNSKSLFDSCQDNSVWTKLVVYATSSHRSTSLVFLKKQLVVEKGTRKVYIIIIIIIASAEVQMLTLFDFVLQIACYFRTSVHSCLFYRPLSWVLVLRDAKVCCSTVVVMGLCWCWLTVRSWELGHFVQQSAWQPPCAWDLSLSEREKKIVPDSNPILQIRDQ